MLALSLITSSHAAAQDPRACKALEHWLASHRAGKLDLDKDRINKTSPGVRAEIVPEDRAVKIGHLEELDAICRAVAAEDTAEAMEHVLLVAAVGLEPSAKGTVAMRPQVVREIGEQWVDRLDSPEALKVLEEAAGDERATKGLALARRVAALRALGRRKAATAWSFLQRGLAAEEAEIRLAAAEASGQIRQRTTLRDLAIAASEEQDEVVLTAELDAMLAIVEEHREALEEDVLRRVADAAVHALGRGSWRSDLAAVELLERVRSAQSVPALIEVLARFEAGADDVGEELRSGLLKERTFEVLLSLTGARFPAEQASRWRQWWEEVKSEFVVAEPLAPRGKGGDERTTTGDFFGIPIRGSRVLFVVDTSGSMAQGWRGAESGRAREGEQKIDVAKRELLAAVARLTSDCSFNLVWFGNGSEAWQRDMVPATDKNKQRFEKAVEDLRPDGGTNLWQGVRDGLKLESLVHGTRYGATYDQLFILSDGMPTLGEVRDPKEILLLLGETNRYSRVRIDTVYIAGEPRQERRDTDRAGMSGAEFMKRLAEENGGVSVAF